MKNKTRILHLDIETAPSLGYYFELYREGNILWNKASWYILSMAWKWGDEKETHVLAITDFQTYKKNKEDDVELREFSDEIEAWIIEEFEKIGLDTARSVLKQEVADLVRRTDLEEETIMDVMNILKTELEG